MHHLRLSDLIILSRAGYYAEQNNCGVAGTTSIHQSRRARFASHEPGWERRGAGGAEIRREGHRTPVVPAAATGRNRVSRPQAAPGPQTSCGERVLVR